MDHVFQGMSNDPSTLQRQIQELRHRSLIATRNGNFRKVAELTVEVARLNRTLNEISAESQSM